MALVSERLKYRIRYCSLHYKSVSEKLALIQPNNFYTRELLLAVAAVPTIVVNFCSQPVVSYAITNKHTIDNILYTVRN